MMVFGPRLGTLLGTLRTSARSPMKIDADEKELLESVERGEWKSAGGGKRERTRYSRYAKATGDRGSRQPDHTAELPTDILLFPARVVVNRRTPRIVLEELSGPQPREDQYLERRFGAHYSDYKISVRH